MIKGTDISKEAVYQKSRNLKKGESGSPGWESPSKQCFGQRKSWSKKRTSKIMALFARLSLVWGWRFHHPNLMPLDRENCFDFLPNNLPIIIWLPMQALLQSKIVGMCPFPFGEPLLLLIVNKGTSWLCKSDLRPVLWIECILGGPSRKPLWHPECLRCTVMHP